MSVSPPRPPPGGQASGVEKRAETTRTQPLTAFHLDPGRFVGYPGNYHTLFGVRNEEVSVLRIHEDRKWGLGYLPTH